MRNDKKIDLIGSGLKPSFVFSLNENQVNVLHNRLVESKKEQKEAEIILDPKNPKDMEMAKQKGLATPDGKIKTQMEGEMTEKAVSKQQQKFFGVVSAMQKGDIPKKGKAGKAAKEMTKKDVKDFASTKRKGLPKKVEDKKIEESLSRIIEDQLFPTMTKNDLMETIGRLMNEQPTIAPTKPGTKEKEKEKDTDKNDPFRPGKRVQPKPAPKAKKEVNEQPAIAPTKPGIKEPGTKPSTPDKNDPFRPGKRIQPKPAPKAQKGNIPDWFKSSSIGIK
jgi:hypothetical protein